MEQGQKSNIGNIILILAAFGFALPLNCVLIAYIFVYYSAQLNIQEYSKQITNIFVIYSIFHISYPFILDKFYTKLKEKPLRFHLKWLALGIYLSYLGVVISVLKTDMNYAYTGVLISLAISFYVITYIKIPVEFDKKSPHLKIMMFIGAMNVIIGGIMIIIPNFFSSLIKGEEAVKSFFLGFINYAGIFVAGLGLGIFYILFVLFRKQQEFE